ncbi:MAG: T9SS type A sorting domain-containing protein [Candidatus Eisenbacteria bacterium]|uniref:T9SS type A sorting domain-containing protein n=1 Tax=Eiseniibacteriota bacterium TaxID=2212470 RepID=A0A7Y2E5W1_UNCEI|nr:T9SS type A sorting domain-containing protein [Candidatus Eisenbacteria bacterium]
MRRQTFALLITSLLFSLPAIGSSSSVAKEMAPLFKISDTAVSRHFGTTPSVSGLLSSAAIDTTYFGGTVWAADSSRWEAIQDSCWTFDSGVGSHFDHNAPYVDPFKDPSLHAYMEGWVGFDRSKLHDNPHFRRLVEADFPSDVCVGATGGLDGTASLYAGVLPLEADALCYVTGQGYGNSWDLAIEKTYGPYNGGTITLFFDYVVEVEPAFDYVYCEVDTSGNGDFVNVDTFTGMSSGLGGGLLSQSNGRLPYNTGGMIKIVFRVTSDGAYSDEDGIYATTCGAFAVDDVRLTGAFNDLSDFESGNQGWSLSAPAPGAGGDWSNIVSLADLPPVMSNCVCPLSDSVMVFEDLTLGGHGPFQDNYAISPWIDLKAAGLNGSPGKVIKIDAYADLPLLNYVFAQFEAQWYPEVCPATGKVVTSDFKSSGFLFSLSTTPDCLTSTFDFTGVISPDAEQVRIGIGVINFCGFFANCTGITGATPWYDNVKFGVFGSPGAPLLTARDTDLPFDSFPENGGLQIDAPGRVDSNDVQGSVNPQPGTSLGDTLVVRVGGGLGSIEVFMQFAAVPGPGAPQPNFDSWQTSHTAENSWLGLQWYSARLDTAEVGGNLIDPGAWMSAYHEDDPNFIGSDTDLDPLDLNPDFGQSRLANDIFPEGAGGLFTPGARVNLFYKARYVDSFGVPTTGVWSVFPDTTGGNYLEMEVLPSAAADSTWNCILYVDHADGDPEQEIVEAGLTAAITGSGTNFEGNAWDRWDVRAPASGQASLGRPNNTEYGATYLQLIGYEAILWETGNEGQFNLTNEDVDVLSPWLTLDTGSCNTSDNRYLYMSGDNLASSVFGEADPTVTSFVQNTLGVSYLCNTVRDAGCPAGTVEDDVACMPIDPDGGTLIGNEGGGQVSLAGNGCPSRRSFDVLQPTGGSPAFGDWIYQSPANGAINYHSIGKVFPTTADRRVVFDGASLTARRDLATCTDPAPVTTRLNHVLTWFGHDTAQRCERPVFPVNIPQPELSDVPEAIIGDIAGTYENTITIVNNCLGPVQGALVELRFPAAADGLIRWGAGQAHPSITGTTDINGEVDFIILAGLCLADDPSPSLLIDVFADAVLLAQVPFIAFDALNEPGQLRSNANFYECGGLEIDQTDMDFHIANLGTNNVCSDFDFDGTVTAADTALAGARLGTVATPEVVWPSCSSLDTPGLPLTNRLLQNAPNPFRSETKIGFSLTEPSPVKITVHDLSGRLVRELANDRFEEGAYELTWDGRNANGFEVPRGIYFYRIESQPLNQSRKMVLLR